MRIDVTQEDIEQGLPVSSGDCPVALAIRRTVPCCPGVTRNYIRYAVGEEEVLMEPAPAGVAEFVTAFDSGKPVAPFSFDIDLPSPSQDKAVGQ